MAGVEVYEEAGAVHMEVAYAARDGRADGVRVKFAREDLCRVVGEMVAAADQVGFGKAVRAAVARVEPPEGAGG